MLTARWTLRDAFVEARCGLVPPLLVESPAAQVGLVLFNIDQLRDIYTDKRTMKVLVTDSPRCWRQVEGASYS